jgi:hypothetical protein
VILPRWTIGCVALVGIASGCSDEPDPDSGPRVYRVLNERGLIRYTYEEPQAETTSMSTRVPFPSPVAEVQQDPQEAEAARELAEERKMQAERRRILLEQLSEQAKRDRQRLEALEEATHNSELQNMIWKRQQAREAMNAPEDRRRARLRGSQSGDQSDADQLRATSLYLNREAERLRQEERRLRPGGAGYDDINTRPFPITIP